MSDDDLSRVNRSPNEGPGKGCFTALAILAGIVLLFPGACFLVVAFADGGHDANAATVGVFILLIAGALFYSAWKTR